MPTWCVDGLHHQLRDDGPVLVVGPAFATLSPQERRGALAQAVVALNLQDAGRFLPVLGVLLVLAVSFTAFGSLPGVSVWQGTALALIPFAAGLLAIQAAWSRSIIYRADRRMTDVLGPEIVAATMRLDERSRTRARGLGGVFVRLTLPSRTRRARRLEAEPPR